MTKNTNFVSHKKSKKKIEGKPQLPSAASLVEGEIAINFAENVETLSIKNESGDVVTFSSDNYYTEKKLGSGFTGANSAVTVTDVIEENEEIIAAALTDIDERKLDASAYTPSVELWEAGDGNNSAMLKNGNNTVSGELAVAEGSGNIVSGNYSHAEGLDTRAVGENGSHAEGMSTSATSYQAHAEGISTLASGSSSHAEGGNTIASGNQSHAEGFGTKASGNSSHAEGGGTIASGNSSHAEGIYTQAIASASHAEGRNTIANNDSEHASGQYNISNTGATSSAQTLFSVGNGTADNARHNAFEIMQNGDIYIVNKEGRDVRLQDEIGNIDIDQVIDSGTSASTNAVSTSAVYKAVTDNELVWTNAFVALSSITSAHTANTEIHVTAADKTAWVNKIGYAKYDSNDKKIYFYKNDTDTATSICYVDATDFIKDGMVSNVEIKDVTSGGSQVTCLVISFNTDAGKQDINIPLTDIFDANNYYTKSQTSGATELSTAFDAIDALVGSGFTSSSITEVIKENEEIVSAALTDLDERKLDASAIDALVGSGFTSSSITEVIIENEEIISSALNDLEIRKLDASAYTPTSDVVTAITSSNSGSTAPIATKVVAENELIVSNALNDLERRKADAEDLDGVKLKKITQSAYDALVQAGTVDPNTLYIITD